MGFVGSRLGVSVGFYSRVYGCYVWAFCGFSWGKLALGCWSYVVVIDAGWMLRCMRLVWRWVF